MKLASIEKIVNITPIEGADKIELAQVLGWQTIIRKGEFKIGELVVWHNPDTIVDESNPAYEFLRKNNFRLKTIKMKGQFSQGLILSLNCLDYNVQRMSQIYEDKTHIFRPISSNDFIRDNCFVTDYTLNFKEGDDVSELIKIKKYEKVIPACLAGVAKGNFPTHLLPKTDEALLKSNPDVIKELASAECYATIKCDGSSGTFIYNNGEFMVCSRNLQLEEDGNNALWKIVKKYNLKEKMQSFGANIAIQGECVGPGIQKNPMGLSEIDFYAFNFVSLDDSEKYKNYNELLAACEVLGLKTVQLIWSGIFPIDQALEFFQDLADKTFYSNGKAAEGIVIRPYSEQYSNILKSRLSVKVINQNYND